MTEQLPGELPPWEQTEVLLPRFNSLMKLKKAALVALKENPTPDSRGLMGAATYRRWKKEELAWEIARAQVRYEYKSGKTGI